VKKLYTSENRILLYLLKAKLEAQQIFSIMKNEAVSGPAGGEVPPVVAKPELWIIEDKDYPVAERILNEELSTLAKPAKSWECPACHETLEGQFDVCWNCGHSRSNK